MSTNSEKVKQWRLTTKSKLVQAMGGKCQCCGYSRSNAALEFHHLDPNQKDFGFASMRGSPKSWPVICKEVRKCILVCSNCHKEIHYNQRALPNTFAVFDERFLDPGFFLSEYSTTQCPVCQSPKLNEAHFCSRSCQGKHAVSKRK